MTSPSSPELTRHHPSKPTRHGRPTPTRRRLVLQPGQDKHAPRRLVDATGTRRRLQALAADGWSLRTLAAQLGMSHVNITEITNTAAAVTPATAVTVAILYRTLANQPPPRTTRAERISAAKARAHASAHGWVVADGWNDDEIDDPTATPYLADPVLEIDSQQGSPGRPRSGDGVHKRCSDCRNVKPVTEYARNRAKPDGRHNLCKCCQKQRRQQRQEPHLRPPASPAARATLGGGQ